MSKKEQKCPIKKCPKCVKCQKRTQICPKFADMSNVGELPYNGKMSQNGRNVHKGRHFKMALNVPKWQKCPGKANMSENGRNIL